jgi:uncharacterized protein YjbI with pentapeptide repeats
MHAAMAAPDRRLRWDDRAALVHWAKLCGPAPVDTDLQQLLRDEVKLRAAEEPEGVRAWQEMLARLIGAMLRDGMPMEVSALGLLSYRLMDEHARRSEIALLAALNACALATESLSQIDWPTPGRAHAWIARLQGEEFSKTPFPFSCLARLSLNGASLEVADLLKADLTEADLTGAVMYRAILVEAKLTRADLTRANLIQADLTEADLKGANLTDANLTEADLTGANLTDTDLSNLNLDRAVYSVATVWPDDYKPEQYGARLAS